MSKQRWFWVSRDRALIAKYEVWDKRPYLYVDGTYVGELNVACRRLTFSPTDFEQITDLRLKPGEIMKIKGFRVVK